MWWVGLCFYLRSEQKLSFCKKTTTTTVWLDDKSFLVLFKYTSASEHMWTKMYVRWLFLPQDNPRPRFQGDERDSGSLFYTQRAVVYHMTPGASYPSVNGEHSLWILTNIIKRIRADVMWRLNKWVNGTNMNMECDIWWIIIRCQLVWWFQPLKCDI